MKLHWWIAMPGKKQVLVFVFVVLAVACFCSQLPEEAWRLRRRQLIPFPLTMAAIWVAGWFVLFFVRAEDLHVLAPFDFQSATRYLGVALIGVGSLIAGMLYLAYL